METTNSEQQSPTTVENETPVNPMLGKMQAVREAMPVYETRLVTEFPKLTDIHEPMFIGSFAWTAMFGRWKYIKRSYAIDLFNQYLTPADVARDYIRAKYEKPGRITSKQYLECVKNHRTAPLYAEPCKIDNAVYIDLKSAYWSILQVVGWDADYLPGRWLAINSSCADFPLWKNKMARNCIVSVGMTGDGKRWTGEKLEFQRKSNPLTNMVLYALVQDVLNSVASDMVAAGALYVHTDGYIFPMSKMEDGLSVLSEWGLVASVRHQGHCEIFAVGTYEIGDRACARAVHRQGEHFDNIDRSKRDWLKPRFSHFANRTKLILG